MLRKRLQLSLLHLAVAMTLVPINSTLNRVMIKELALSATLVAVLASFPYIFSPIQVWIGSFSDRHPILGWRRSPYILFGLLLCVLGVVIAPWVVFLMPQNYALGLILSLATFGAWGMGFNFASVSYLALASELSGEKKRTGTVSLMWFIMILGIIVTAASLSGMLREYSPALLRQAFEIVGAAALGLGLIGLIGLEPRTTGHSATASLPRRSSWTEMLAAVTASPETRRFFIYLILLLAAILGQDVLLEPYAAEAFQLTVQATTRITSIWGGCVLAALLFAGVLERWFNKRAIAQASAWTALTGFLIIAAGGILGLKQVFYGGVMLLGFGTGLSTVANLSLMLDMTTDRVGLFIGAWGVADALARLTGTLMSGVVRDSVTLLAGGKITGYVTVFFLEAGMLLVSIYLLRRIDVNRFQQQNQRYSLADRAAWMNDAGS